MANDSDTPDAAPEDPAGGQWRFSVRGLANNVRDPRNIRRLVRMSAFVGVTSAVVGSVAAVRHLMIYSRIPEGPEISLSDALQALDDGYMPLARELAADLRGENKVAEGELGGPAYVLGVAMFHDAQRRAVLNPGESRALYSLAAGYLAEATAYGFPPGREGYGRFLLGRARYETGQFAASLAPLSDALTLYPEQSSEIHRLLARAYSLDSTPQLSKALEHIESYLEDGAVTGDARENSLLTAAEIQFKLGDLDACGQTVDMIGEDSPSHADGLLMRGRILMRRADDIPQDGTPELSARADAGYQAARDAFEESQVLNPGNGELVRKSQYLAGLAAMKLRDYELAERQFSHTRRSNYDTPEGLAAGFEEAEAKRILGKDDEAIHAYSRVLRQALDMPVYSNPWISKDQLRQRSEDAYNEYFVEADYVHAIEMANALTPLTSQERSLEMQANAYRAQAKELQELAGSQGPPESDDTRVDAQAAWRRAAAFYEQLAQVRFATRLYPETIWLGADGYLNGHDYRRAGQLLRVYLANQIRRQHPAALTALGEAELALGEPQKALVPLSECIEFFPRDPHTYRARIIAAEANRELGNLPQARDLLNENLENEGLVPSSAEWHESLYALGKIRFYEGMERETAARLLNVDAPDPEERKLGLKELELAHDLFQQAILRLSEAVQRDVLRQRDKFASQTLEARYLIAQSYRQAAKLPLRKMAGISIETTRNQLNNQIQQELSAAAASYLELQKLLNQKQLVTELSTQEERMLRNSYFSLADSLYDLENYEEAIAAYGTATNRYQNEPESLEAYVQIANCHRQLNRHAEARGTLEQAKVVLNRIRADADFTQTTRYDREEWEQLLDWLITL